MKRLCLLVAALATVSCNAVLGIEERELETDSGSTPVDSSADVTIDTELDSGIDTGEVDSTIDAPVEETADSTLSDTADTATPPDTLDSSTPDTAMPDTAMPDTADTAMPDTADTAMPDTAADAVSDAIADADAPSCGAVGTPCCGAVPASCNGGAVCQQASTGMCVAAFGACARRTDCPVGTACGGPSNCAGEICYSCTSTFGSKPFGAACAARAECASGICDTFRGTCSAACSNGITHDADCAGLGTKIICTELTWSTSGASGKIGFCTQGCDKDSECPTGKVCRSGSNNDANRVDQWCGPSAGSTPYGSACTSSNQCVGGSCISFGASQLCTPFCTADADCASQPAWKKCATINFTRPKPGTGTQPAKMCGP